MGRIAWLLSVWFVFLTGALRAQTPDSALIDQLLNEIAAMQYTNEAPFGFKPGMFYSYKKWAGYPHRYTPDNNIFFTGLVAFTLQEMAPRLTPVQQAKVAAIVQNATKAYPYFQNKKGLPSYFFWPTGKPIMPNTYFIYKLTGMLGNPEDIDDTVMILMTMGNPPAQVAKLKQMMDSVANGQLHTVTNTFKKYKNLPAHSTYLGHKWRVDFDLAVHCNVLYFLYDNQLPFNRFDSATLELVTRIVKNREYVTHPKFIAPYYLTTPVLVYHLARLMGRFSIPELEPYKQQLIADAKQALKHSTNIMQDILLSTSLIRLGTTPDKLPIHNLQTFENSNKEQFVFYEARPASQSANPLKSIFLDFSMLNYQFFSPAYNKALLLEYLVLRR